MAPPPSSSLSSPASAPASSASVLASSITAAAATGAHHHHHNQQPQPFDPVRFLSRDARARAPSGLKSFYPITVRPGMRSLGGGLPHPDTFSVTDFSATIASVEGGTQTIHIGKTAASGEVPSVDRFLQYAPGTGWSQAIDAVKDVMLPATVTPQYADWDLILTHGNTTAFDMCMRILFEHGDGMIVEEFAYSSAMEQIVPFGVIAVSVKMDDQGLVPSDIPRAIRDFKSKHPNANCRVLYTVPTGQNPTGTVMSVERRKELLKVANELDLLVIEDDPYSFLELPSYQPASSRASYEYKGIDQLLPPLLSLDTTGRVINMFTFSKILGPGFRAGFLAGHKEFIKYLTFVSEVTVQSASGFSQAYLAALLQTWGRSGMAKYALRLQQKYTERRDVMVEQALEALKPASENDLPPAEFVIPTAGMFLWIKVNLPATAPATLINDIHDALIARSVLVIPGSSFVADRYAALAARSLALAPGERISDPEPSASSSSSSAAPPPAPYFRVAFSYANNQQMREAMSVLGDVLREFGCGVGAAKPTATKRAADGVAVTPSKKTRVVA
ncbi:pyridoxal phosphate-dependent transferase [Zopfochytrium polystomum]|nr:pyridoxal phosphate-dependent transferase [Zopfochytrium polystomum]